MSRSMDALIFVCWQRGDTISETIRSVKRKTGELMEFETVRLIYVDLSEKFASPVHDKT